MHAFIWRKAILALFVLFLVGCNQQEPPTPMPAATPLPAISLLPNGSPAKASGVVLPKRSATLSFPVAGRVERLQTAVGDRVGAGTLLAALENTPARAALTQAQGTLFRAQARLAELQAGPRPQEIAAAQAAVDGAQALLAQLQESARPEELAAARANLAAAQAGLQQAFAGPREEQRIEALAALANAKAALQQAQSAYNQVSWRADVGALPESRALQIATNEHEAAQARYDALFAGPAADVVAAARAQVQQAQANLDRLNAPASEGQIAEAEAKVAAAQAALDLLTAGPRDEELAVAGMAVAEAEAAVERARAEFANTELRAPFTGTVTALRVEVGEMAQPGQAVATLADLSELQVETTDLSERDVARLAIGQAVTVFVKPLNQEIGGSVLRIAPQSTTIGGDVVYPVRIALDAMPTGLHWGMSVEVEITTE